MRIRYLLLVLFTLKFRNSGSNTLIELPDLPADLRQQPARVLRVSR